MRCDCSAPCGCIWFLLWKIWQLAKKNEKVSNHFYVARKNKFTRSLEIQIFYIQSPAKLMQRNFLRKQWCSIIVQAIVYKWDVFKPLADWILKIYISALVIKLFFNTRHSFILFSCARVVTVPVAYWMRIPV